MGKVFLSHSSVDKTFVEPIADLLSKQKCVYDKYTFETGEKTLKEIFRNLESSDIFVYFISDSSLDSKWVNAELNKAKELLDSNINKLSQIFPIIIDSNIDHKDKRIPSYLREEYNIQRVDNYKVAFRKIIEQMSKFDFNNGNFVNEDNYFYGRNNEISLFKQRFDDPHSSDLKSMIVSGMPGIGKKSFVKSALIEAQIIPKYYNPVVISLNKNSNIEDLIIELSNAGYDNYSIEDISKIRTIEEKTDVLTNIINKIQSYNEIVIVEDNENIVDVSGTIKYWFHNAIKKSNNGIALIITSNVNISKMEYKKYPEFFISNLIELSKIEIIGILRTVSNKEGVSLSREDSKRLSNILSGYPPQIIYCIDLIKEEGIDYVKQNSYMVANMPEQLSAQILDKIQGSYSEREFLGLLAMIAEIEIVPMSLINKICKINSNYRDIVLSLRRFSVCYLVGAANEYLKMNSFIQNYITRNKTEISSDIKKVLREEMDSFNNNLENNYAINLVDLSEIKYFIKENLKKGTNVPSNFLYSTIIVQTIIELYHKQQYKRIIEIVNETKETERYEYFDQSVKNAIQRYFCQALIKNRDCNFESEVQYFAENKLWVDFYSLLGINKKYLGDFQEAKNLLNKALNINKNHYISKRELVQVYIRIHDYDSALLLACENYRRNKDNIYLIQPYFECLLAQKDLNTEQKDDLETMLETIKRANRINPTPLYYQLMGQYIADINDDINEAMRYINEGLKRFQNNMYILRIKFELYRRQKDIRNMKSTLEEIKESVDDLEFKGVYISRQAIVDLFEGKSAESVRLYLKTKGGFSEQEIDNVIEKNRAYL